jgi:hypothetical protein
LSSAFDGGERHRVFEIVLVEVAFAERGFPRLFFALAAVQRLELAKEKMRRPTQTS